eukprot:2477986-Rhodomonas_salina.3
MWNPLLESRSGPPGCERVTGKSVASGSKAARQHMIREVSHSRMLRNSKWQKRERKLEDRAMPESQPDERALARPKLQIPRTEVGCGREEERATLRVRASNRRDLCQPRPNSKADLRLRSDATERD